MDYNNLNMDDINSNLNKEISQGQIRLKQFTSKSYS